MGSTVRDDPNTYLLKLVEDLQKRVKELEQSALTSWDITAETLRLGSPSVNPEGIGDASFEGSLVAEGYLNLGSPTTAATTSGSFSMSGNANIDGTLSGGTHTHTGLVTNGDSHDHDGGDGNQIPTGGIAANAVDDTKAGNRVPQFYRRQGGSSSNWSSQGSSNYTPTAVRMQAGVIRNSVADGDFGDSVSVTFPTSFSNTPLVLVTLEAYIDGYQWTIGLTSVSSSGCVIYVVSNQSAGARNADIAWLAIGPE
jgi:hypothetical protein